MATDEGAGTLEALQIELAFQADTLHALDAAFAEQQRTLLTLQRQVELLTARLKELGERFEDVAPGTAAPAKEPPPPHY